MLSDHFAVTNNGDGTFTLAVEDTFYGELLSRTRKPVEVTETFESFRLYEDVYAIVAPYATQRADWWLSLEDEGYRVKDFWTAWLIYMIEYGEEAFTVFESCEDVADDFITSYRGISLDDGTLVEALYWIEPDFNEDNLHDEEFMDAWKAEYFSRLDMFVIIGDDVPDPYAFGDLPNTAVVAYDQG